jgi:hypothetical protein
MKQGSGDLSPSSFGTKMRVYLARHRKNINENLSLIIALLATAFAGWSGYEAYRARLDALYGLKIAQRSYVEVEQPEITWNGLYLVANHTVKVYGNSPALKISLTSDCQEGMIGELTNKPGGIQESDLTQPALEFPTTAIEGTGQSVHVQCRNPHQLTIGVVLYGAVHYTDVFGDPHYSHFCYFNFSLNEEALKNPDPKKWNQSAINAGKQLIPCNNFNDSN